MNRVEQMLRSESRPLLGMSAYTYNPTFVEIIGLLGYKVLWIEMEHALLNFSEAADLCRIATGLGLLTMIRIPDAQRVHVLKAAECGPDIIDLPMGNSPEILKEFVRHAKYAPEGERGFFGASRAVHYGLVDSIAERQEHLNDSICLISQVETREAVERVEELVDVQGINGIFIGPGDLSLSMGIPGEIGHTSIRQATIRAVEVAKSRGKIVALAGGIDQADEWAEKGVDIIFGGSDISCMKTGAQDVLSRAMRSSNLLGGRLVK